MAASLTNVMPTPSLIAAYRRTHYCVCLHPSEVVLRVDCYDPFAEYRILSMHPLKRQWSILTPCNPHSSILTPVENTKRLDELRDILDRHKQPWIPAFNRDPKGCWPDEAGVFLCDPPADLTELLGRRFGQIAFLSGCVGEAPRLVWITASPACRQPPEGSN